jgi:hypothetical protein
VGLVLLGRVPDPVGPGPAADREQLVEPGEDPFYVFLRLDKDLSKAKGGEGVSILWILLIVILVLALLGFFSRGYW